MEAINPYQASAIAGAQNVSLQVPSTPGMKNIYVQLVKGDIDADSSAAISVLDEAVILDWPVQPAYWSYWETWVWVSIAACVWIVLVVFGFMGAFEVSKRGSSQNMELGAWLGAVFGLFPGTSLLELVPITMAYGCAS